MPFVIFEKNFASFPSISPEFQSSNIFAVIEHTRNQIFLERYPIFFLNVHLGPIRWVPKQFFKIWIFYSKNFLLIWDFWVISKIIACACACWVYAETIYRTLSIQGYDFIAHWARSIRRTNFRVCSASGKMLTVLHVQLCWAYGEMILSHTEHTRKWFKRWLNIRGNDFIADWAYAEMF